MGVQQVSRAKDIQTDTGLLFWFGYKLRPSW